MKRDFLACLCEDSNFSSDNIMATTAAALLLVLAVLLSTQGLSAGHNHGAADGDARTIYANVTGKGGVNFQAVGFGTLEFRVTTTAGNTLQASAEFFSGPTTLESSSRILFHYLQELLADGSPCKNCSNGGRWPIGRKGFSNASVSVDNGAYSFSISEIGGFFTLAGYLTPVPNKTLTPDEIRYTVTIDGWSYQNPSNRVAILTEVRMYSPILLSCGTSEIVEDVPTNHIQAVAAWSPTSLGCFPLDASQMVSEGIATTPLGSTEQGVGVYISAPVANASAVGWNLYHGVFNIAAAATGSGRDGQLQSQSPAEGGEDEPRDIVGPIAGGVAGALVLVLIITGIVGIAGVKRHSGAFKQIRTPLDSS